MPEKKQPPYFDKQHPSGRLRVTTLNRQEDGRPFNLANDQKTLDSHLRRIQKDLQLRSLAGMRQVHGVRLEEVNESNWDNLPQADGLFTTLPGLGLMVRQADCQAITLHGPQVAANLHVGWRGNVQNLPGLALSSLCRRFADSPRQYRAYISPSLGPCCAEFVHYRDEFPAGFRAFMVKPNHFNLWAISAWQLISQGLLRSNLEISGVCSKCDRDFYSYRRGDEGRFATIAARQKDAAP